MKTVQIKNAITGGIRFVVKHKKPIARALFIAGHLVSQLPEPFIQQLPSPVKSLIVLRRKKRK